MWLTIRATITCGACGSPTAVNAAVERVTCNECGAEATLRPELWRTVLSEAAARGTELARNATAKHAVEQAGSTLRLELSRTAPRCPHCGEDWSEEVPSAGFACPACGQDAHVRPPPIPAPGVRLLAAEDRALWQAPTVPETLSCPSCAAPLVADGSARKLPCGACGSEVLLSDDIWRRLHAPRAVAPWLLWIEGVGEVEEIDYVIGHIVAGRQQGRLFALGANGDSLSWLLALDTEPMRIAWTVDLEAQEKGSFRQLSLGSAGEVLLHGDADRASIERFDPDTGEHLGSIATPDRGALHVAADPDGTMLVEAHPSSRLHRISASGVPSRPWPPGGCLGRLFGIETGGVLLDTLVPRPGNTLPGTTVFASGQDGLLRIALVGELGCLDREGNVRWKVRLPRATAAMARPAAGPDGTTWGIFLLESDRTTRVALFRVDPGGKRPVALIEGEPAEIQDVSVDGEGAVWVLGRGIRRLDREGRALWQWAP